MTNNKLKIVNPLEFEDWDALIATHSGTSFFHTSSWARVLQNSYGYKPMYFTRINDERLSILIPMMEIKSVLTGNRGVSLPFTDTAPPLFDETTTIEDYFGLIVEFGMKSGWKKIELRGISPNSLGSTPSADFLNHTLHYLEDNSESALKKTFRSSTIRNVKRAIKEGVHVSQDNSLPGMVRFCQLNYMTRRKHGLPPQPFKFFRNLYEHTISKGKGIIVLATHGGVDIAGAVYLHFGKEAIYKYGASDLRYQGLRANNLIMWEAIMHYNENNYERFSFGRTESYNEGLRRFKAGWGTVEETINYYTYDLGRKSFVNNRFTVTGWHNHIFQRMPKPTLRLVGKIIYRHIG